MSYLHGPSNKGEQIYQDYLELCRQSGRVLTREEVRANGLEPNDLAYRYGSFAAAMEEAKRDLKMQTEGAKVLRKPVEVSVFSAPLFEERVKQIRERKKQRIQQEMSRHQHLVRYGDTKSNQADAQWQEDGNRVTRSEVMSYMRGLLKKYPNATQPDARKYSTLIRSRIFPKTVKTVLGAKDWDEVMELCREKGLVPQKEPNLSEKQEVDEMKKSAADVAVAEAPRRRGRPKGSKNKPKEQQIAPKEEVVVPKEQSTVSKKKPGRPKKAEAQPKKAGRPKKTSVQPKKTSARPQKKAGRTKQAKTKKVTKSFITTMELKILVPGMPEPIVMEFSIK